MGQQSIASALGIQHGADPWHRRAACAGYPLSLFFAERGSNHSGEPTIQEDRGKRVCARCEVRRECLTETISSESPQVTIARNKPRGGSWNTAPTPERQLPVGIFGGTTPAERWSPGVIHLEECPRTGCKGCRPDHERIALLEEGLSKQTPRFLLKSEKLTALAK